ncbi:MAG TPA: PilZ domain-containing protein [Clostridiales bacterium]|nr:PilZ domain-containing protein [Clostridiales bacterium]
MDMLATPDVISFLEITGVTIKNKNRTFSYSLFAFSQSFIALISTEQASFFDEPLVAEIRTKAEKVIVDLIFDTLVKTSSGHWITQFSYYPEKINSSFGKKWMSLLTMNQYQQVRKEKRILMNKKNISALQLQNSEVIIWVRQIQKACVLHDLSFSGARFFSTDDINLDADDKNILKFTFINPMEIATVRTVVLRKQCIKIGDVSCLDIAVRFLDPVDLVLLSRMTKYFQLFSDSTA